MEEHIFVVRIWRENREIEGETPRFRGMIQHMGTGEKKYFNDINVIAEFVATNLNLSGATEAESRWLPQQWREKLKRPSSPPPTGQETEDGSL